MGSKLIPRYQEGGSFRLPSLLPNTKVGSSLAETALLKARNAQSPNMNPIQPISLSNSTAAATTGLGGAPFSTLDTKTLAKPSVPTTGGMDASGIGSIAGAVGSIGVGAIDLFSKAPETDQFGLQAPESKGATESKSALTGAAKGVGTGAMIGSVVPGVGTAIGAVVGGLIGGVGGFLKGKKQSEQATESYTSANSAAYGKFYGNQYANQFQAMKGKDGMKLKTAHIMSNVSPSTTLIPKMKNGGSINVIAAGKLHKENNNIGDGDKGIPVINKKGKKIFELEKEELILNLDATKRIEKLVNNYNKQNDSGTLEELGRLVHKELMTNTQDNSEKYGLEV